MDDNPPKAQAVMDCWEIQLVSGLLADDRDALFPGADRCHTGPFGLMQLARHACLYEGQIGVHNHEGAVVLYVR